MSSQALPLASARIAQRRISVIDSHTCGQPTRVICEGVPEFAYTSLAEAREILRAEHDWLRTYAVFEPRGHPSLFAAALVPALDPGCATGVVFMDAAGYPDMCGHATIGVVTTLVDLGRVSGLDEQVEVAIETPGGRIETRVTLAGGRAESVAFVNQPAFFLEAFELAARGESLAVSVAFGGQWYAFIDPRQLGLAVEPDCIEELVRAAAELQPAIAASVGRRDPRSGEAVVVENVMWFDDPVGLAADGRNMPVNIAGNFDRSPCGTGTSARLAVLHAAGRLEVGQRYVNSSVLGTTYEARILSTTTIGETTAVVPEITGSAWVTGRAERWAEPTDPLAEGFLL